MNATTLEQTDGLTLAQLQSNPFAQNVQSYGSPEDDKKLHVRFYLEPVEQGAASILANRRVFADTEYVEIMIPGDKQTIIKHPVFEMDKQRFPTQYARFKQGLADQTVGSPLTELVFLTQSKIKEYAFFNIRTVEQLTATADSSNAGQQMMGFQGDKQKAVAYLSSALGAAPVNELRDKIEQRDGIITAMQEQLKELSTKLEKATNVRK